MQMRGKGAFPFFLQGKRRREGRNVGNRVNVHLPLAPSFHSIFFSLQNYQLFRVVFVDAGKSPPLYKLEDMKKKLINGYFYRQQLTKTSAPQPEEYFRVEAILKKRRRKGKKELFVKYLHYPARFNEWIPEENLRK